MNPNLITLSHPTYVGSSGATAAATYPFMTRGFKPAIIPRTLSADIVVNQNGKFKYVYDNGPGFRKWNPFEVACEDSFSRIVGGGATVQFGRLMELWNYPGIMKLSTPEGVFSVHWSQNELEPQYRIFPHEAGSPIEYSVTVQFEEAS